MFKSKKSSLDAILDYKYKASWNIFDSFQFRSIKQRVEKRTGLCKVLCLSKIRRPVMERLIKDNYGVSVIYDAYGAYGSVVVSKSTF